MDFRQANFILEGVVDQIQDGLLYEAATRIKLIHVQTEALADPKDAREYAKQRAAALAAKGGTKKPSAQGTPSTQMKAAKPSYPEYKLRGPMPPKNEGVIGDYLKGVKKRAGMFANNAKELGKAAAKGGEAGVAQAAMSGKLQHPAFESTAFKKFFQQKIEAVKTKLQYLRRQAQQRTQGPKESLNTKDPAVQAALKKPDFKVSPPKSPRDMHDPMGRKIGKWQGKVEPAGKK